MLKLDAKEFKKVLVIAVRVEQTLKLSDTFGEKRTPRYSRPPYQHS